MSERDPRVEAEVLARKAEDDANAMRLLADAEISDEIVGFHAQQAVEKWLKAVLGSRGIEFEPIDRQSTLALVNDVGDWAVAQLPSSSK